ncbi:hypothetical protein DAPPUDRAFT_103017 [Daphnia pulex]|uniref:Focal AT domain-containing protein n=1 Tax=Daphnia pulex TaxID=6669 RepID=E9GI62_DAPPU|nr:hypothetical protein DAPPUDRAFT_103017 [Daphnia pulex]|eukprot:EFX80622.1 hypothetical protein DAPPUDRAFT_103017 [Daphnia pulex]
MTDATPPTAAIAGAAVAANPAQYKDVRGLAHVESNNNIHPRTWLESAWNQTNHLASTWSQKDECSNGSCANSNGSRKRIVAGWPKKSHLRKRLSVAPSSSDRSDTDSMDGANAYQKDRSTPLQCNQLDERAVVVKKLEPTPTARLDRTHDKVYDATTSVVRAVILLSQGVQQAKIENYVDLVEMAHKVLSQGMAELGMLSAAHVLAMNAINLLDVVDHARIKHPHVNVYSSSSNRSQDSSAGCSTADNTSYQISSS